MPRRPSSPSSASEISSNEGVADAIKGASSDEWSASSSSPSPPTTLRVPSSLSPPPHRSPPHAHPDATAWPVPPNDLSPHHVLHVALSEARSAPVLPPPVAADVLCVAVSALLLHPRHSLPVRSAMAAGALALVASALADAIPGGAPGGQVPALLRVAAALAEGGLDRERDQRCRRRSPVYRSPRAHAHPFRRSYRSPPRGGLGDPNVLRRRQRQQERLSRRQQRQLQQRPPPVPAPAPPGLLSAVPQPQHPPPPTPLPLGGSLTLQPRPRLPPQTPPPASHPAGVAPSPSFAPAPTSVGAGGESARLLSDCFALSCA
ncbi:unnamed protein product [Closterium sp. Naga37s-1]|nr:unnamed protein product [Closterium sp. Naga37s-1]